MSSEPATGPRRAIRIGKYEVVAHIATGGMGAVYRATDTEENREVALKVLTPEMAAKPAMLERFRREGRNAAKLRHENIVTVYEFAEVNGTYYIAMEYVDGIDLHDYIDQKGTVDPEESRQIMIQATRALAHAHSLSIVHRDIKPSNFLVTRKHNKVCIKLTDLGLARETVADEFRVTRAGTTVGTVDYISPEQARDSGSADVRSDIYSLGCTWFHMLAGHPPFPEGGLAERLYKHMEAEPPDMRELNPRVSRQLAAVLNRMLAKKPADRYQDPTELLQALNEMTAVAKVPARRETVAENGSVTTPGGGVVRKPTATLRKEKETGGANKKSGAAAESGRGRRRAAARRRRIYFLATVVSVLVVAGVALAIYLHRTKSIPAPPPNTLPPGDKGGPSDPRDKPPPKPDPTPDPIPVVPKGLYKPLYKPAEPIDVKQLRAEVEKPWAGAALPDGKVLSVSRVSDGKDVFSSVEEALKNAPAEGPFVIEINDNGPLFEPGCDFGGRQVKVRAGKGYRPLIVWDHERDRSAAGPRTFLKVGKGGSLTLENLDFALQAPETKGLNWTLFHTAESDLLATDCTFSQAGNAPEGVVLARFEGARCRFTRCFARGNQLVALDLHAPDAQVLFDGCLVVGGDQALLQVRGEKERPATVRVVRSTLIAAQTLLSLKGVAPFLDEPALTWFGWDALLSRAHPDYGGRMVELAPGAGPKGIRWNAVNCLYAGWEDLLTGSKPVKSARGIQEWQSLWKLREGDDVRSDPWPRRVNLNVATDRPSEYRPGEKVEVGVASTLSSDEPLGCDTKALPPAREEWLRLIPPERIPTWSLPAPDLGVPAIPTAEGGAYTGESIDVAMTKPDLGVFLQNKLKPPQKVGEKVVLHLLPNAAVTDLKFTPFAVPPGTSLAIYYGKKDEPLPPPLKLEVAYTSADAVLSTEKGGALELTNLEFRLPESTPNNYPPVLLKVHGDLRLQRCRLLTADGKTPPGFKALIDFHGSGEEGPDRPRNTLVLHQTILYSFKPDPTCVRVFGPGARLLFQHTLLVAGGDGVAFHFGEAFKGRANVECWFQNSTLAARRSAVVLNNAPSPEIIPAEPVFVRSKDCAFLNPFPAGKDKAGLLRCAEGSLGRGLLLWQSEGDAFDKRLHYVASTAQPAERQAQTQWEKLWGWRGVRNLLADAEWDKPALKLTLDSDGWAMKLDRLELPSVKTGTQVRTVGVKMADLGIKKRP